jgi:hypothetical protein
MWVSAIYQEVGGADRGTYVCENVAKVGRDWCGDDGELGHGSASGSEDGEILELHLDSSAKLANT